MRHDAYYIERIEGPDGEIVYQHQDPGTQAVPTDVALTAINTLKGVIKNGTVESSSKKFLGTRPAAGKTGTYENNTNATFVGFTTQLSAAVWLGNPLASGTDGMRNIPEFRAVGVSNVHGGNLPYRIWEEFIAKASEAKAYPEEDWPAPPKLARGSKRLYLPGMECLYTVSAAPPPAATPTDPGASVDPTASTEAPAPVYTQDRRAARRSRRPSSTRPRPWAPTHRPAPPSPRAPVRPRRRPRRATAAPKTPVASPPTTGPPKSGPPKSG